MAGMQARTFVLVTGVSNYGDEANNLAQTTKDAKNFAKVMSTQTKDHKIFDFAGSSQAPPSALASPYLSSRHATPGSSLPIKNVNF